LSPYWFGGAQIVISDVDSILLPKNEATPRKVEPTPGGPSEVHSADLALPCHGEN
jgi:hypothetical protein